MGLYVTQHNILHTRRTVSAKQEKEKTNWIDRILSQDEGDRFDRWVELLSAIVLSLATILTAWCGYQATRWSGVQAENYSLASDYRTQAAQITNQMLVRQNMDVGLFVQYAAAVSIGNDKLADFLYQRFPPELRTATDAWLATDPLHNPNAPRSPFDMPEYVLPEKAQAAQLEAQAKEAFETANDANEKGDEYVLYTIIFAAVLFLGGISGKFQWRVIDALLLAMATITFVVGLVILISSPMR